MGLIYQHFLSHVSQTDKILFRFRLWCRRSKGNSEQGAEEFTRTYNKATNMTVEKSAW